MLVVSDTSPISGLLQIGRAELLPELFGIVCVPPSVSDELAHFHTTIPAYVEVRSVLDQSRVKSLLTKLHIGEAEAIVLAAECQADYLLIDERRGRAIAAQQGVPTIGLLGVLLLAKQRGLVAAVKECLVDLQSKAGFYLAEALVRKALEAAQE